MTLNTKPIESGMSEIRAKTIIKIKTDSGAHMDYTFVAGTDISHVISAIHPERADKRNAVLDECIEAVKSAVRQYGQNSVAYIHTGDKSIKVIKAIESLKTTDS